VVSVRLYVCLTPLLALRGIDHVLSYTRTARVPRLDESIVQGVTVQLYDCYSPPYGRGIKRSCDPSVRWRPSVCLSRFLILFVRQMAVCARRRFTGFKRIRQGAARVQPNAISGGEYRFTAQYLVFSARCNIYISRLCYDASVRLSVTEVHWRIIANLGFKFRSKFTAHCGRGERSSQQQHLISRYASHC